MRGEATYERFRNVREIATPVCATCRNDTVM